MKVKRKVSVAATLGIVIIIVAIVLSIFFAVKYFELANQEYYGAVLDEGVKNGSIDENEYKNLINYLTEVETGQTIEYQTLYEDLYVDNDFKYGETSEEKVCYLTFDDGPNSEVTPEILDTLSEYGVKATFFVIYGGDSDEMKALYKRIVDEGHTIGVHTYSHKYKQVYASVESYLDDFYKMQQYIKETTGVAPEIFRFPGGSINSYNSQIHYELAAEMIRRGYTFYDWNASSGDAEKAATNKDKIVENVINTSKGNKVIVLMHDGIGHKATAEALPQIIEGLQAQGYTFDVLDKDVKPILFG